MIKLNFGCGPDLLEGFVNVDKVDCGQPSAYQLDILKNWPFEKGFFDLILVNHTLTTMTQDDATVALKELYRTLAPGGKIQVIEMDILKAYQSYVNNDFQGLPGSATSLAERFVNHLGGNGRLSLYTPLVMEMKMKSVGFANIEYLEHSDYDLRPKESMILVGKK